MWSPLSPPLARSIPVKEKNRRSCPSSSDTCLMYSRKPILAFAPTSSASASVGTHIAGSRVVDIRGGAECLGKLKQCRLGEAFANVESGRHRRGGLLERGVGRDDSLWESSGLLRIGPGQEGGCTLQHGRLGMVFNISFHDDWLGTNQWEPFSW